MDISVMQKMIAEKKLIVAKAPSLWRAFRRDVSIACDRSEGVLRLEYDMKPDEQLGMEKAVVIDLTPMPETRLRLSYNEIEAAIYSQFHPGNFTSSQPTGCSGIYQAGMTADGMGALFRGELRAKDLQPGAARQN